MGDGSRGGKSVSGLLPRGAMPPRLEEEGMGEGRARMRRPRGGSGLVGVGRGGTTRRLRLGRGRARGNRLSRRRASESFMGVVCTCMGGWVGPLLGLPATALDRS